MLKRWIALILPILLAMTASVALATSGLSGTYQTTISKPPRLKGVWKVTFSSGRATASDNGHVVAHDHYTISGSTITFKPNGTCKSPGKYSFKLSGKTLRFTKVSDPCNKTRAEVLSHKFTKV